MAIMEANPDSDVMRVWVLLNDLSEQLSQNRNASISLHTVTGGVKDKSQDEYNAELERMNMQMSAENLALQNDNKQLNALIKEYEQTLENLMTTFRNRANEVQQRELAIMREYERKILLRETEELSKQLDRDTAFSTSLGRVGRLLRALMRMIGGEDSLSMPPTTMTPSENGVASTSSLLLPHQHIINALELEQEHESESYPDHEAETETDATAESSSQAPSEGAESRVVAWQQAQDRETQLAAAEWALERECELARLELENRLLRQLVAEHEGVVTATSGSGVPKELPTLPRLPARARKGQLGGKDVGPFGMYKSGLGAPLASPSPSPSPQGEPGPYRQG
ncbi:hypothetical protein EIP86_002424 [Pleurotus ostreatoroseus]|nr:hypothetical protein EIP86_002424 [Pleurotus ostreatoroseus]